MENLMNWYGQKCEEASFNRLGLMAFVLLVQTCIIIPATLLAISINGNHPVEFALVAILSFSVLVSFLGDLSTRVTIPLFVVSTIIHLLIILINVI